MSVEKDIVDQFLSFRQDFSSIIFDVIVYIRNEKIGYAATNIGFVIDGERIPAKYHHQDHDLDAFHDILKPHLPYLQENKINEIQVEG